MWLRDLEEELWGHEQRKAGFTTVAMGIKRGSGGGESDPWAAAAKAKFGSGAERAPPHDDVDGTMSTSEENVVSAFLRGARHHSARERSSGVPGTTSTAWTSCESHVVVGRTARAVADSENQTMPGLQVTQKQDTRPGLQMAKEAQEAKSTDIHSEPPAPLRFGHLRDSPATMPLGLSDALGGEVSDGSDNEGGEGGAHSMRSEDEERGATGGHREEGGKDYSSGDCDEDYDGED